MKIKVLQSVHHTKLWNVLDNNKLEQGVLLNAFYEDLPNAENLFFIYSQKKRKWILVKSTYNCIEIMTCEGKIL
jgi:hypothetical protein